MFEKEFDAPLRPQPREGTKEFSNASGVTRKRIYTPLDLADTDYGRDIGMPGEYPFTRGIHATMYRGRMWTMRLVTGYGTAEDTNARFKNLLAQGMTGLSIAFDLPTLYGYDSDAPEAMGEVGKGGTAVSSLADMEILVDGLPLDQITTSLIITAPAAMIWAMYIVAAEKRGVPMAQLGGTTQNDILKEYLAQKEFAFPPRESMRLVMDTLEFGARHLPKWNTLSVSGYHIREAGSTAAQELAFTLANGFEYVRWALERGMSVDEFAPRLSFFFSVHNDFLQEIAKFRAARRIWARELGETFRAQDERSWFLRFHTQTAGATLTAQQPENNIVRVTLQALAAVLGGTQSLHTNALDEALALPSEGAARIALRTQQIIAHESGVTNTVDPLGGAYLVEALTNQIEREAYRIFQEIENLGGVIPALERCYFQRALADAAARYQNEIEQGVRKIVGVNAYQNHSFARTPRFGMDRDAARRQQERLARVKRERDNVQVQAKLDALRDAARGTANLMPYILDATRVYATLQEMMDVLREVFGTYREPVVI